MKKYLISNEGNFYKANLHCHTTISDGTQTPEEVKKIYMEKGYSIVAFTDHDVFVFHDDLTDDKFLALNGYEMEFNNNIPAPDNSKRSYTKTAHICFIAIDKDNKTPCCLHRTKYLFGNSPKHTFAMLNHPEVEDFEREHSPECINKALQKCRDAGYFITYNHPTWSRERYYDYINYQGMHAMEMVNGECLYVGCEEHNERVYDDFLDINRKIYCIATDDNHSTKTSGLAWTMIKAPCLEYNQVTKALLDGQFYASEGPEIKQLYVEDGYLCIETSPVNKIMFKNSGRRLGHNTSVDGVPVTSAKFPIYENDGFVRITIIDQNGKYAYTNAYDAKEILK
jgi:hypothetical protein